MTLRRFSTSSLSTGTKSHKLWDGETFPGYFESIATVVVGSAGAANVEFTSIPATYSHLQIRMIGRLDGAVLGGTGIIRYNGDTNSSNYTYHELQGNGTAASAYGSAAPESVQITSLTGTSATASVFGVGITDILDYANTNKYKTQRNLGGFDNNGSGRVILNSGLWMNTAAITSIKITPNVGSNFVQYSHFALYGIRSA